MLNFDVNINPQSNTLKYLQLVDAITDAINENTLSEGSMLPSVNDLIKSTSLSRDTVFKAYRELKSRGIIESVPNKGYFVTRNRNRVLLFLDTFKAYKEVLYDGFRSNLPDNISVDLHFHHYNIEVLETILHDSIGKYSHYIVMSFDHPRMAQILNAIPAHKLLIIDWGIHASKNHSFVCQDFKDAFYNVLVQYKKKIASYKRIVYLYPEKLTYHPRVSIGEFKRFIQETGLNGLLLLDYRKVDIQLGDLYILVSDRTLAQILDQATERNMEEGHDFGIISYNETPMKRYVKKGISVISTDFTLMGKKAAEFVMNSQPMQYVVPIKLIERNSF